MHFDHTASPFRLTEPEIPRALCCTAFEVNHKKETPELKVTGILETNINSQGKNNRKKFHKESLHVTYEGDEFSVFSI